MIDLIKPKSLNKGDTLCIMAPASPTDKESVTKAKKAVENLGFNVLLGESCFHEYAYLSGVDEVRARDLNNAFSNDKVNGILCLRGGYGTPRILDMIDYGLIKKNPKVFIGYSDITSLHIAINQKSNLVTFHGPMAASNMVENFDEFTRKDFMRAITKNKGYNIENPDKEYIKSLNSGYAEGEITGGNLTLITSSLGTPYEIDTKRKILFIEEISERPYQIDRMLTQLRLANKFNDASGIIFGDFKDCVAKKGHKTFELVDIFNEIVGTCGKPIIYNVKSGHCKPMITIPFGVKAELDADKCELRIIENTVEN